MMQTEPMPNRLFNRSTMGIRLLTSAILSAWRSPARYQLAERNRFINPRIAPGELDVQQLTDTDCIATAPRLLCALDCEFRDAHVELPGSGK